MTRELGKNLRALVDNWNRPAPADADNPQPGERCRIVLLEGGSRSTKTWSTLEFLLQLALQERLSIWVVRDDGTTCRDTVIPDMRSIIALRRWGPFFDENRTDRHIASRTTGATIVFRGTSDILKLHGPAPDIVFFNELMAISANAWIQLGLRARFLTIGDWNPSLSRHWIFDGIEDEIGTPGVGWAPPAVMPGHCGEWRPGIFYVHSTHQDNPHLPPGQRAAILNLDPARGQPGASKFLNDVYNLGLRGRPQGAIFQNWETTAEWPHMSVCQRYWWNVDWGFTVDPTALVEVALARDMLFVRCHAYKTGLLNVPSPFDPQRESLLSIMDGLAAAGVLPKHDVKIYYDSAQPESAKQLELAGYRMVPYPKFQGSVMEGIRIVQHFPIRVWHTDRPTVRELENYRFKERADGTLDPEKVEGPDHVLDGIRGPALAELPRTLAQQWRQPARGGTARSVLTKWG